MGPMGLMGCDRRWGVALLGQRGLEGYGVMALRGSAVIGLWGYGVMGVLRGSAMPQSGNPDHNPVQRQLCRDWHLPSWMRAEGTLL